MIHKHIIMVTLLLSLLGANRPPGTQRGPDLNIPTASDILEEQGFNTTDAGLVKAMASDSRIAQQYAITVALEQHNPIILDAALPLISDDAISRSRYVTVIVQIVASEYLASFRREEGLRRLRAYASTRMGDPEKSHIGVIKASAILAELGDESYIYQIQRILDQGDVGGIPLALGSFHTTNNPAVERAWLTAVQIVKKRIQQGDTESHHTVVIDGKEHAFTSSRIRTRYINPLWRSVRKQTIATPKILVAFEELAKLDHPASKNLRIDMLKHWRTCELRETSQ